MIFWKDKRILVTGGGGFLGKAVVAHLQKNGCSQIFVPRKKEYDLRTNADIEKVLNNSQPDLIIHLAAVVGGIQANSESPGSFFYDNLIMGVQLMEQARLFKVKKFVAVGTICA